jgi:hypothetical protein
MATNQPRVPTATDDVLIDVPSPAQITFNTGTVTVNSIVSNDSFQITGGRLNVTDTIQVNSNFLIRGTNVAAPATFSGTILKGTGGQGVTIEGEDRLDNATIETDVTLDQSATHLRIANGLTLTGTATVTTFVVLGIEGNESISSGTFVTSGSTPTAASLWIEAAGNATVTFGHDVTIKGNVLMQDGSTFTGFGTNSLHIINQGTFTASGPTGNYIFETSSDSMTNQGIINTDSFASLWLFDKTWTNTATGKITVSNSQATNFIQGEFGLNGTTWSNAGTIELNNTLTDFMPPGDMTNKWSNTGSIVVNHAKLQLDGSFTSDDVVNVRSTGDVIIAGLMDNTGRTFTFNTNTTSYLLSTGHIKGGTLVMGGPSARLEFEEGVAPGVLDGVTIQGDVALSPILTDPISGTPSSSPSNVSVVNGLTLLGTMTFFGGANDSSLHFDGAQTVSGGTFQFALSSSGLSAGGVMSAQNGGPVVFESSVTIHAAANGDIEGNIISYANVVIDANSGLTLKGFDAGITNPKSGPFDNRANISVPSNRTLTIGTPFVNEGQITAAGGTVQLGVGDAFSNTGTIDMTGHGRFVFSSTGGSQHPTIHTSDLGTFITPDGIVSLEDNTILDNTGSTLSIAGTATWALEPGSIVGGTVNVASTATLVTSPGTLKDVTVNGNVKASFGITLVGNLSLNGTVTDGNVLTLGDSVNYPNVPVHILAGTIDMGQDSLSTGLVSSGTPSITLDSGVVLRGRGFRSTITAPITNKGLIVADQAIIPRTGEVFDLTAAPITNQGTLAAVTNSILKLSTLVAPNSGIVSAAAGSSVSFTGDYSQAPTGTVHVDVSGAATSQVGVITIAGASSLAGILDVQFASGFTPVVGSTYKVMTYASHTGQFGTFNVTGLAAGLIVTPQYNGTDVTLVVSAAASGMAFGAGQLAPMATGSSKPSVGVGPDGVDSTSSETTASSSETTSSARSGPSAELFDERNANGAFSVTHSTLRNVSQTAKAWSEYEWTAAIDDVFADIADGLSLSACR